MVQVRMLNPDSGEYENLKDRVTLQRENAELQGKVDDLQAQIDLVTPHLSRARALRNALITCNTVGWPVNVSRAFYPWQETLNALVFIPAAEDVTPDGR